MGFCPDMRFPVDTLIVWTELDGVDYALSFQDPEGCAEVWNFILEVQQHLNASGSSIPCLTASLLTKDFFRRSNKCFILASPRS